MLNKIYKRIHNKYSTLFRFIFFLRYLFGIFFISLVLFLLIPYFFDFKKKDEIIKSSLLKSYGLQLNKYENIKYYSLPSPHLEIKNAYASIEKKQIKISIKSLSIYPKLINIYNYEDFELKKIVLNKNQISLSDTDLKILISYIYHLKNRLNLKNLDLKIKRNSSSLVNLKKIYFSNYGYNKNIITGKLINKKFKILIGNDYHKINFKLPKTGISADINFNSIKDKSKDKSIVSGVFKSKLINSNLKFNFDYDDKKLKIYNSYFRSSDLSFNNKSILIYRPFFSLSSIVNLEDVNVEMLKNINIIKVLGSKDLIKKINMKNEINFKSKKYIGHLIDNLNINFNLAYGRLSYKKEIFQLNINIKMNHSNLMPKVISIF